MLSYVPGKQIPAVPSETHLVISAASSYPRRLLQEKGFASDQHLSLLTDQDGGGDRRDILLQGCAIISCNLLLCLRRTGKLQENNLLP